MSPPDVNSSPTTLTARRTTLRPGAVEEYCRVHASIPRSVDSALRAAGVVSWRIWGDGVRLFHVVETTGSYEDMVARVSAWAPVDPAWDDVIASLLDDAPGADELLASIWSLDVEPFG